MNGELLADPDTTRYGRRPAFSTRSGLTPLFREQCKREPGD